MSSVTGCLRPLHFEVVDYVAINAQNSVPATDTIRALRTGTCVPAAWGMTASFCGELETWLTSLKRSEMKIPVDGPLLAKYPTCSQTVPWRCGDDRAQDPPFSPQTLQYRPLASPPGSGCLCVY